MSTARQYNLVACSYCQLVSKVPSNYNEKNDVLLCPRCQERLSSRAVNSLSRTWALLIAATILYIPANMLPMMYYVTLGKTSSETIMQSIIYFIEYGMWPIAMVVFVASIVVPILKLVVMSALLLSVHFKSAWRPSERAKLFHIIKFIGRWSMVDIFVVALVIMLVQFGNVASIQAGAGALSFAAVVILTMFASHTFDPRLIWDNVSDTESNYATQ